jgi:hypothetical protein
LLAPKFGILINPFISISQKFGLLQSGCQAQGVNVSKSKYDMQ